MALTREILTANAELSGLTDAQIAAITTLSQNDENSVIGTRIGEIYRQMDTTIATATGVQRNGDEKTYDYLARATKDLKTQVASIGGLNSQIAELNKEKARLEKVIADGAGDAETRKALNQAQKDLAAVTKQYNDLKGEFDTAKVNHEKELFGIRLDGEFANVTKGFNFKPEFPQSVTDVLVGQAIAKVKTMNPEYIDDGKGGKVLVFKDATDAIMRNPENQLNPYTASDLIAKELKTLGILAEGKQNGGGTSSTGGGSPTTISGARTQTEASEIIIKSLLAKGLVNGSKEFQDELDKAWKDNNVASLPIN